MCAHMPWTTDMVSVRLVKTAGELKHIEFFVFFFNETIIPLALVGYEIVNSALMK